MAPARPEGYALREAQMLDALLRGGCGPLLGVEGAAAPVAAPTSPLPPGAPPDGERCAAPVRRVRVCGGMPFMGWRLGHGDLLAVRDDAFPTIVRAWSGAELELAGEGTHYGIVRCGPARLRADAGMFTLRDGMWFALPGEGAIGGDGDGLVVTALHHAALFALGGPLEDTGRLRYIDGCTDTLLAAPARLGDPCLNALYFPPGTDQTAHTHPSLRAGVVLSGRGTCRLPDRVVALEPGLAFVIEADAVHAFATTDDPLVVVAYHPDSDAGPTDESHPMITRTLVGGVPASELPAIRTGS